MSCKNWREDSDSHSFEHEVCAHKGYVSCCGQRSRCIHPDNYRKEVKMADISMSISKDGYDELVADTGVEMYGTEDNVDIALSKEQHDRVTHVVNNILDSLEITVSEEEEED